MRIKKMIKVPKKSILFIEFVLQWLIPRQILPSCILLNINVVWHYIDFVTKKINKILISTKANNYNNWTKVCGLVSIIENFMSNC